MLFTPGGDRGGTMEAEGCAGGQRSRGKQRVQRHGEMSLGGWGRVQGGGGRSCSQ